MARTVFRAPGLASLSRPGRLGQRGLPTPLPPGPERVLREFSEIERLRGQIAEIDRRVRDLDDRSDEAFNRGDFDAGRELVFEMNDLINEAGDLRWLLQFVESHFEAQFAPTPPQESEAFNRFEIEAPSPFRARELPGVLPGAPRLFAPGVPAAPAVGPEGPVVPPPAVPAPPPFSYVPSWATRLALSPFAPAAVPFGMGQLVQFRPDVQVSAPIQVNLGALPLSLGLFAGSALAFLTRGELPEGAPRTLGTLAGVGLAVGGILNLFRRGPEGAAPGPAPAIPGQPGGGFAPPAPEAFASIAGRILSPVDFSTVDLSPFESSYPVRVQVSNPSSQPATFTLELRASESPSPFGDEAASSLPTQVSLGPGEVRNVDVRMPIAAWGALADFVDISLEARKRRSPSEDAQLLDSKSFVVE